MLDFLICRYWGWRAGFALVGSQGKKKNCKSLADMKGFTFLQLEKRWQAEGSRWIRSSLNLLGTNGHFISRYLQVSFLSQNWHCRRKGLRAEFSSLFLSVFKLRCLPSNGSDHLSSAYPVSNPGRIRPVLKGPEVLGVTQVVTGEHEIWTPFPWPCSSAFLLSFYHSHQWGEDSVPFPVLFLPLKE